MIRTYSELIKLPTFQERFEYLKLGATVGEDTFGYQRYLNQVFYTSARWKKIRNEIIVRDTGCDLAMEGYDIYDRILIHHLNPLTKYDIENETEYMINPEYLICTTLDTHNAIHYGDFNRVSKEPIIRTKNDTCPWRK